MSGVKPLAGVKVVELGQLIAGPFAGKFFADFGAEPAPSSPEDFAKFIQSESAKWGKLIAETGIKGE